MLLDPADRLRLEQFRQEARQKHQTRIDFMKSQVGGSPDQLFSNDLLRLMMTGDGFWYQFIELPEEFSGAVGTGWQAYHINTAQALEILDNLVDVARNTSPEPEASIALLIHYGGSIENGHIIIGGLDDTEFGPKREKGVGFHPGVLPTFFKVKICGNLPLPDDLTGINIGIFIAYHTDKDHLFITVPLNPGSIDLTKPVGMVH